jgi:hypothetical protein
MEIRPLLPDLLHRQLEERDAPGIARTLDTARGRAGGVAHLMRAMRRFAGHHTALSGEWPATVVLDAVGDLLPACAEEGATELLRAAAAYLLTLPAAPPDVGLFDPETPAPDVIPISLLEDALASGDLRAICQALGRLATVIRSHEAFLELLLEAAAADTLASGRRWVHTSACVKAIHDLPWEDGRGVVLRWAEDLASGPIPHAPAAGVMPGPIPVRAGFAASLTAAEPSELWPPLAHAFQGERYAETRRKSVRVGLRAWVASRLFDGDHARMEAAESALRETAGEAPAGETEALPDPAGRDLAERIRGGDPACSKEAGEWAARLTDVDALYRWIALAAAARLGAGDGATIVTVNAARWGSHLLRPRGAERITGLLVARLVGTTGREPV